MKLRRTALGIAGGAVALLFVAWPDILAFVDGARPHNVKLLYDVRGTVRHGMSRDALNATVSGTHAPVRTLWRSRDELLVWAPVGFMESVYLQVLLASDVVVHARIRGDSGEIVAGAPADF